VWKVLAESVRGSSHERDGTECQDSCLVTPVASGNDVCLVVACADGAGSAIQGGLGARTACQSFCTLAARALAEGLTPGVIEPALVLEWYRVVRAEIASVAERDKLNVRDLACTLLTAVVTPSGGAFAQVGDGFIVVGDGARYDAVTWPTTGEYANITTFLTSPEFEIDFDFVARPGPIDGLAMSTDGLQRLALSFASKEVHVPFFAPMFQALRESEFQDELAVDLRSFLNSPAVNERTDDDKTLVLAVWSRPDGDATAAI
jgi:hypothetical protein